MISVSVAKVTSSAKIIGILSTTDCDMPEIAKQTGLSYATVLRKMKLLLESGEAVCISEAKQLRSNGDFGRHISARFIGSVGRADIAEELIYRLVDKLLNHKLDDYEIALVKDAQKFINSDIC